MSLLPAEFAELEPFAAKWCLATELERWNERIKTPMPEIVAFYDAIVPRAEEAIAYCDRYPLHDLPEDVLNLMHLLYSMIIISFPVEAWGQQRVPDAGAAEFPCVLEPTP